ncbi:MAG: transglycosylase SLT domain-containing protein [Pigmentiphaga sp.]
MSMRRRLALRSWLLPLWLAAGIGSAMVPAHADVAFVGTTADSRSASVNEAAGRDDAAQFQALQRYIGDKYRVPLKAVRSVIDAARDVGQSRQLDPLLLLAVMAIESSFNPKAQSHKGAQGLMQVMTRIHRARFEPHGGVKTAFKPAVNIDVGAQILQECIDRRGSVAAGLSCYVGMPGKSSRYGQKVLAEFERLRAVIGTSAPTLLAATEAPAPPSVLVASAEGAAPVVVVGPDPAEASAEATPDAAAAPPSSTSATALAAAEVAVAETRVAEAEAPAESRVAVAKIEERTEPQLAAADTEGQAVAVAAAGPIDGPVIDPGQVIQAPPISRFVEADAPRLARTLLGIIDDDPIDL